MDLLIQDRIVEQLEQERYYEASVLLDRYLRLEGKDEFYYLAASDIKLGLGEYRSVLVLLDEAMEDGIDIPLVWERRADALMELEDYAEAARWLERTLDSGEPEDEMRDLFNLGRCRLAGLEYDKAIQCFEDILLEEENTETRFLLGMAYGGAGNISRMRDSLDKVISDPEYRERTLEYLTFQDDLESLCHYVRKAGCSRSDFLLYVSRFCYSHEDVKSAAEYLNQAAQEENSPVLIATAVLMLSQEGYQTEARRLFRQLMENKTDAVDPEGYASIRLEALESLGYAKRTRQKLCDQILKNTDSHPDAQIRCAEFLLASELPESAYDLLKEIPKGLEPAAEQDWFNARIAACLQIEHYQEAYNSLKNHQGSKDRTYRKNLAIASYCTGRNYEALDESLAILPDGIGAIIAFLIYDECGDHEHAAGILERMQGALAREEPIDDLSNFIGFLEEMRGEAA